MVGLSIFAGGSIAFGAFNPTGGGTYYLQASINSSQTTITLSSFTEPSSGIPYTMSYLNSVIEYGTINPNSPTSEFISFSGITQNANGTAILTGVTRGLGRSYPYIASTTLAHSVPGQTQFILSAPPEFYNQYYVLQNTATSSGTLIFGSTTQPRYDGNPTFANPLSLIDKAYADALSITGAPTSTFSGMGVVWLATRAQTAAGTASSTSGAPLVIPNRNASSTYNGSTVFQGLLPALRSTFDIDPNFIATSSGNNYVWGGLHTFNATTTFATTTVASSTITSANFGNASTTSFRIANLASTTNLVVSGTCKGCTVPTQVTSTFTSPSSSYSTASATATCGGTQLVVGGGYTGLPDLVASAVAAETVQRNYPSATNAWTVRMQCSSADCSATGGGATITVYAICVNP